MSLTQLTTSATAEARKGVLTSLRQYQWKLGLGWLLLGFAAALLLSGAAHRWPHFNGVFLGVGLAVVSLLAWALWAVWKLTSQQLIPRLDRHFPQLEDSTGLLFTEDEALLPRLQRERVAERLLVTPLAEALPIRWWPRLLPAALMLALGLFLWRQPVPRTLPAAPELRLEFPDAPNAAQVPAAPRLLSTQVRVQPPAYTRRAAYAAASPSFQCPQSSLVRWQVKASPGAPAPELVLAGSRPVRFRRGGGAPDQFVAEHRFQASSLYRIRFAGHDSEDYAVEVVPDQAPALRLLEPAAYSLITIRKRPEVTVRVALQDDYGLTRARLVVTTAQGSGEGVKFGETTLALPGPWTQQPRQHTASASLNLPKLGLTFGDELYVYAEAWDNAGRRTRTDAHLVQWEDTAATGDLSGISLGVNPVPVYFRSQRQIIIDTEKLIKERKQLSAEELQTRANSLGEDQKLLRLRYGKFLGEEYEEGITEAAPRPPIAEDEEEDHDETEEHHADDGHNHAPVADDSPTAGTDALIQSYSHLHDDAETADFLEPQVKAKLRAVLNEMWNSELRLRLAKPTEALPYAYRALRLLKEVQQQTRAYVRKSGVDLPPIPEAEKRLTGDFSTAAAPQRQGQREQTPEPVALRRALGLLSAYRAGQSAVPADAARLEPAGSVLGAAALREPGAMLASVRAWRQLLMRIRTGQQPTTVQISSAERALTRLLPTPTAKPAPAAIDPLARRYFRELSR